MLKPRALRPGDRLAVVAPASPFPREEFDRGIIELGRLGFEPVFDPAVFERRGYLAGGARVRAEAISAAWRDPSIAGVIAVRGGYGTVQVLPRLDPEEARRARKPFVGYSDLTSLLIFLSTGCGLVCFHGPMLAGALADGDRGYDRDSFLRCLMNTDPPGELAPSGLIVIKSGDAIGPLYGGTLTQIVASLGTPFAFNPPEGHLLFLEDAGERPYRLDRMLTQLRLSGVLDRAAGLVIGELPGCDEPGGDQTALSAVSDCLDAFDGPVLYGFPSGHTTRPALTLPLGVRARLVASTRPRLVIEEAAVERS